MIRRLEGGDANKIRGKEHWNCGGRLIYCFVNGGIGYRCNKCNWEHIKKPKMNKNEIIRRWEMGYKSKSAQKVNFGKEGNLARAEGSIQINEGETLEGIVTAVDEITMQGKPTHNYTMEDKERGMITFLGTASLDRLLKDEQGSLVRITYKGDTKATGSGFNVKLFEVEVWEDEGEGEEGK